MINSELNWKVAGYAGEGIMTTGLLLSKTCSRHGLYIFDYTEYPSLIRGGHNTYQLFASTSPAYSQRKILDLLVAMNKNALVFHKNELNHNSLVLFDQEDDKIDIASYDLPAKTLNIPMVRLARESGAERLMANNVALGASVFLLGLDMDILNTVISDVFGNKGSKVVELNQKAARAGYDYAGQHQKPLYAFEKQPDNKLLTLTGNEAIGLGAIAGGLHCYFAYPMTPSSSILHYLASKASQGNFVVKHAEDEISAVNMAIGASFSGARVMVGTSGGGFCYMTEAVGFAGIAEVPLVVVDAMRPGPALGMPTWTAQADLQFILNAAQDEFPRFVLVPSDAHEAFHLTRKALELAEKYQTVVFILSDKYLSESRFSMKLSENIFLNQRYAFAERPVADETGFFKRYFLTESGVSPRSIPGDSGGMYINNSYEHDIYGFSAEESIIRKEQVDKRFRKLTLMQSEVPSQLYEKLSGSSLTFISFGSTKNVILAARKQLEKEGIYTDVLNLSWIWPFPADQVVSIIKDSVDCLIVEGNSQGQLQKLIAQETGIILKNSLRRYDGRPFFFEDIVEHVKTMKL